MNEVFFFGSIMIFLIVCIVIIYFMLDYMKYKDEINNDMLDVRKNVNNMKDNTINKSKYNKDINQLKTEHQVFSGDIYQNSSNINRNEKSINNFEESLQHYMVFKDKNNDIQNKKMFEHILSNSEPNLDILAQTTLVSDVIANKNFKICNNKNECINMKVDNNNTFNITPDKNSASFSINSANGTPQTKYDFKEDVIYFGGSDMNNSPMFIANGQVYFNKLNLIANPSGNKLNKTDLIDNKDLTIGYDSYESINVFQQYVENMKSDMEMLSENFGNYYNNLLNYFTQYIENNGESIGKIMENLERIIQMPNIANVYYTLKNQIVTIEKNKLSNDYASELLDIVELTSSSIILKVIPKKKLFKNDIIYIKLPENDFGKFIGIKGDSNILTPVDKKYFVTFKNIEVSSYDINDNENLLTLTIASNTNPYQPFIINIEGIQIIENRGVSSLSGITVAVIETKLNFAPISFEFSSQPLPIDTPPTPNNIPPSIEFLSSLVGMHWQDAKQLINTKYPEYRVENVHKNGIVTADIDKFRIRLIYDDDSIVIDAINE